mgnify:FL=1
MPPIDSNSYYQYVINNSENNISTIPQILNPDNIVGETIYATISGVCGTNNTISIIDQVGCVETIDIFMTVPETFEFNIISNDVSCPGEEDGYIYVEYSGGIPPYSYQWLKNNTNYAESENISNLSGGEYIINVTDLNNCLYSDTINIYEAEEMQSTINLYPPQCNEFSGYVEFEPYIILTLNLISVDWQY